MLRDPFFRRTIAMEKRNSSIAKNSELPQLFTAYSPSPRPWYFDEAISFQNCIRDTTVYSALDDTQAQVPFIPFRGPWRDTGENESADVSSMWWPVLLRLQVLSPSFPKGNSQFVTGAFYSRNLTKRL